MLNIRISKMVRFDKDNVFLLVYVHDMTTEVWDIWGHLHVLVKIQSITKG